MIKVDERTHARLAELAAEQGSTIGALVGELAGARRTRAEWAAIGQQTREYVREHLGYDPTPDERTTWEAEHAAIMSELDRQFAARRRAPRATG
jgi:uroporphyrinogen-III synthase